MFMLLLLLAVVVILVLVGQRCGRVASLKPIPTFDGPIPPHKAFDYDRVVFMPSKDQRPLLVYQANVYELCNITYILPFKKLKTKHFLKKIFYGRHQQHTIRRFRWVVLYLQKIGQPHHSETKSESSNIKNRQKNCQKKSFLKNY